MAECVVDGVVYTGVVSGGCGGCAGLYDNSLCGRLGDCSDLDIIWVKKESQTITEETLADSRTEHNQTAEVIEVFPVHPLVSEFGHHDATYIFSDKEVARAAAPVLDLGFGLSFAQPQNAVVVNGEVFLLTHKIVLSDNDPLFAEVIEQEKLVNQAIAKLSCDEAEALKNYFGGKK